MAATTWTSTRRPDGGPALRLVVPPEKARSLGQPDRCLVVWATECVHQSEQKKLVAGQPRFANSLPTSPRCDVIAIDRSAFHDELDFPLQDRYVVQRVAIDYQQVREL